MKKIQKFGQIMNMKGQLGVFSCGKNVYIYFNFIWKCKQWRYIQPTPCWNSIVIDVHLNVHN
jgi:hypothetical protein